MSKTQNIIHKVTDDENIDYDKVLNSKCSCGIGLPWLKDSIVMVYPCEHMFHEKCYNKFNNSVCPLCHKDIDNKFTMFDKNLHHQRFADILSVSYYDDMSHTTPGRFLDSLFDLASVIASLPFLTSRKDIRGMFENVFSLNNLTLRVYGMDKLKLEKHKVYICNHVAHLEMFIIYYLLGTGFLASRAFADSSFLERVKDSIPLLKFDRGDKNRTVNLIDEMKKFVEEKGSICLFPEGMMKHPDVLVRFRTGAFNVGYPIYAVTIRHNDVISDTNLQGFFYKLGGKRDMSMEVHILGPYYPPFNESDIEMIRMDMARHGNMVLSRVANRDLSDVKEKPK